MNYVRRYAGPMCDWYAETWLRGPQNENPDYAIAGDMCNFHTQDANGVAQHTEWDMSERSPSRVKISTTKHKRGQKKIHTIFNLDRIVTDHIRSPSTAFGRVHVGVCVQGINLERSDFWPGYLVQHENTTLSGSCLDVNATSYSSLSAFTVFLFVSDRTLPVKTSRPWLKSDLTLKL